MKIASFGNILMDRFALIAPKPIVQIAGHVLFWPIACSQYLFSKLGLFTWYNEVYRSPTSGGRVILGGLPWPSTTRKKLIENEKVSAVINLVSEKPFPFCVEKRIDVPLMDFAHPEYPDVLPAVEFLDRCIKDGRTVYVHCRAGKGRSATVVMCWLVGRLGMIPESAQEFLSRQRPHILNNLYERQVVEEFHRKRK
jgi:atypical dual specificity phosphatase